MTITPEAPSVSAGTARVSTAAPARTPHPHRGHVNVDPHRSNDDAGAAIRAFQQERGLIADGIIGPITRMHLHDARFTFGDRTLTDEIRGPIRGDDVLVLQNQLHELGYYTGRVDGVFDRVTNAALRTFQREFGMVEDGVCGAVTVTTLRRLGSRVCGGSVHDIRESEHLRVLGPTLCGKRIALDLGDFGTPSRWVDATNRLSMTRRIAERIGGDLVAHGVTVTWTTKSDGSVTDATMRARAANIAAADVLLSVTSSEAESPRPNGVSTTYFGFGGRCRSTLGHRLAEGILDEVCARTGLTHCRTHPRPIEILRLARASGVVLDVGYLTSPYDADILVSANGFDAIATGVVAALENFFRTTDPY